MSHPPHPANYDLPPLSTPSLGGRKWQETGDDAHAGATHRHKLTRYSASLDQAEEKRRRQSRSRAAAEEVVADNPPRSIGGGGGPRDRGMTSGKRSGGGRYRVGVSSVRRMHVWCLVAPSRGGVLLLGETQASMYEDPFGALGV